MNLVTKGTAAVGAMAVGSATVASGAQTTRAAVRSEIGDAAAIGSYYLSSAGKAYLKVTNVPGDTDWQRVTTSAAD